MKKRELMNLLNKCIFTLTDMVEDVAALEITDNGQASKRLKKNIVEFREGDLKVFENTIKALRVEMIMRPKRVYNGNNAKALREYELNKSTTKNQKS